jgi:peptidoglycan-associated lipoprotein
MKNWVSFLILSYAMLVVGGCANNEVVKKEETTVPTVTAKSEAQKIQLPEQAAQVNGNEVKSVLEPIPQAGELKIALEKIYFDFDSHSLSSKARESLVKNSEILKKDPAVIVQIEGHCDEKGSNEYNLALGEKRAQAAMKYLVTMGIPEKRLSVISYGKEKPAVAGHDEESWAKNRRDEFMIRH